MISTVEFLVTFLVTGRVCVVGESVCVRVVFCLSASASFSLQNVHTDGNKTAGTRVIVGSEIRGLQDLPLYGTPRIAVKGLIF